MINTNTKVINVLYVDDEVNNLQSFIAAFRRHFTIFTALSSKDAELILASNDIHILITDQRMPLKKGTELLAEAVKKTPDQIRILLTGYSDIEAVIDAINNGHIFKYLQKPWNENELRTAIEDGYQLFDLRRRERIIEKTRA